MLQRKVRDGYGPKSRIETSVLEYITDPCDASLRLSNDKMQTTIPPTKHVFSLIELPGFQMNARLE